MIWFSDEDTAFKYIYVDASVHIVYVCHHICSIWKLLHNNNSDLFKKEIHFYGLILISIHYSVFGSGIS